MTIYVSYRSPANAKPIVMEFDEAKTDPFEVCNAVCDRMFPDAKIEKWTNPAGEPAGGAVTHEPGVRLAIDAPPAARMGVRDTSKVAYQGLRYSGALTAQQKLIVTAITFGKQPDWTRQELAKATGLGINAVCGRVNELLHEPFRCLVECGKRRCGVTGENVNALRLEVSAKTMEKAA